MMIKAIFIDVNPDEICYKSIHTDAMNSNVQRKQLEHLGFNYRENDWLI